MTNNSHLIQILLGHWKKYMSIQIPEGMIHQMLLAHLPIRSSQMLTALRITRQSPRQTIRMRHQFKNSVTKVTHKIVVAPIVPTRNQVLHC